MMPFRRIRYTTEPWMRGAACVAALVLAAGCGPSAGAEEVAQADSTAADALSCRITHPEISLGTRVAEASGAGRRHG